MGRLFFLLSFVFSSVISSILLLGMSFQAGAKLQKLQEMRGQVQVQKHTKKKNYYDATIPNPIVEKAFRNTGTIYLGVGYCHGTFISPTHFLTAAHCVDLIKNIKKVHVSTFSVYKDKKGISYYKKINHFVKKVHSYKSKNESVSVKGDFAVVELKKPIKNYFPFSPQSTNLKSNKSYCFITDRRVSHKKIFRKTRINFKVYYFNKNIIKLRKKEPFAGDGHLLSQASTIVHNLIKSGKILVISNLLYVLEGDIKTWKQLYFSERRVQTGYSGGPIWCYDKQTDSLHLNGVAASSVKEISISRAAIMVANHLNDYTFNWIKDKITKK